MLKSGVYIFSCLLWPTMELLFMKHLTSVQIHMSYFTISEARAIAEAYVAVLLCWNAFLIILEVTVIRVYKGEREIS